MQFLTLKDVDLKGRRVLIRSDLNVPIKDGVITSDARIQASLPTFKYCLDAGAKVILMSHLGRPTEGEMTAEDSLAPIANALSSILGQPVRLITDYLENSPDVGAGELVLLENVRTNIGEKKNDEKLARRYANLCDIFVMDAFGTAHRAQASTYGVAEFAPIACAGLLVEKETVALTKAFYEPARPLLAIVGGSKVSTKLTVLESLADKVDYLVVAGGIGNTFLAAEGHEVGKSLCEHELVDTARKLNTKMHDRGAAIPLPTDVVCGKSIDTDANAVTKDIAAVEADDIILDIGPDSTQVLCDLIQQAGTIIWNGPTGLFELPQFSKSTEQIAEAIAHSSAYSLAGGGDTVAAIQKFGVYDKISYISTAGGAFLEFLEGKKLPALAMLEQRAQG